ncbi:hypothetical protein [Streptomyces atratus]|uniref:hypothetical protein n=1 Tax=Streptomyces atratus TaxID=1893 RepID=UPI0036672869
MDQPLIADVDDVRAFAATLPAKFLRCRDLGHNMGPHDAYPLEGGGYERILKCRSCKAKRLYLLDEDFSIINTSYDYPDGYLAERGTGRIDRDGRCVFRGAAVLADIETLSQRQGRKR